MAGLMLGFSIYLAMNIANLAARKALGQRCYGKIFWIMVPLPTYCADWFGHIPLGTCPVAQLGAGTARRRKRFRSCGSRINSF